MQLQEKVGKTAIVISSDSEASLGEVDFPNLPISNQPLDSPAEEQMLQLKNQNNWIIQFLCQKTHPFQWQIYI